LIDEIIKEPEGGAHRNREKTFELVQKKILAHFKELSKLSPEDLVQSRMDKYTAMGSFND
jgi:acetyl-CoA carboxylase carboxyl transferase subunit alpha